MTDAARSSDAASGDKTPAPSAPLVTEVRGARVHNLRSINVDVPLQGLVAVAGVSGSGKSSFAIGVLYAEGSRRYIEALSTYTRRRMAQAPRAQVDSVRHVPAALALRQRPGVPGVRSTFGTSTELLNVLRIAVSRLGEHLCPNGHRQEPSLNVAAEEPITCPVCGVVFTAPSAEDLAFNSGGACPRCQGTGAIRDIDDSTLIPDPTKTIADGAVDSWKIFGMTLMPTVVAELGVRTDVPYDQLTPQEQEIVMSGPPEKRHITVASKNGKLFPLDWTYRNARAAVQESMNNAKDESGLARIARFIRVQVCPLCHGSRLSQKALSSQLDGRNLAQASSLTLDAAHTWLPGIVPVLPEDMRSMASMIVDQFTGIARRLLQLGLGYLTLDRASNTLSTGERQRVQLSRAVRNETTGVMYVLDEPSIGLHPANVEGLIGVMRDLGEDGNSVVFVDHDVQVLREADWMIEIGPGSGTEGGTVLGEGPLSRIISNSDTVIGPFLAGTATILVRTRAGPADMFDRGAIHLTTHAIHTVHPLDVRFPKGRLIAVTGMSGSGKTTLVIDSLVPALVAQEAGEKLPEPAASVDAAGTTRVRVVDSTPIGVNVRSTVATYSGVLDELRKAYAETDLAKSNKMKAGDFSYNTGSLRCPRCQGTGQITLDVQFLPDVDIPCPLCGGRRYSADADQYVLPVAEGDPVSLPTMLGLTAKDAERLLEKHRKPRRQLQTLIDLGLGYLTLNQSTPALSGGEAQRLKLSTELSRDQSDTLFVLDEPSVGLHPLDVRVLISVLDRLISRGATIVVIEHDLDLVSNADYVIDLGPGGGTAGGQIVAVGTPDEIADDPNSVTGRYLVADLAEGSHGVTAST